MGRPLIAVPSYPRLAAGRVQGWTDDGVGLPARYVDALRRADAVEAVFLPEFPDDHLDDVLDHVDGVLLVGGGDLDPGTYGETADSTVYGVSPQRDECELALVRAAVARNVPLLGVCRGHQVLAVALGSRLDQHITGRPGLLDHGAPGVEHGAREHPVDLEPDSRVARAMHTTTPRVSSHHHQAVGTVSPDMRVVARAPDGTIEAIELARPDTWVVGVQWHPEDTAGRDPAQQGLFDAFVHVSATAHRSRTRPRSTP